MGNRETKMNLKKITLLISAMFLCSPAFADSGAGTVGLQFLNDDFSPRALGMGGAFVAVADDAHAPDYNPAGLGQITYPEVSAMYYSGFDDAHTGAIHFGMLMPQVGFSKYARPALGLSLISASAGDITYRPLTSDLGPTMTKKVNAQQDYAFTATYAEKFFVGDIILEKLRFEDIEQYYGINIKYVRSTLVDEYTGNAFAGDLGYLLKHNRSGLSFGMALTNMGSGVKYIDATTKMPSVAKSGLAWLIPTLKDHHLRLSFQGDFHLNENYFVYRMGAEYLFDKFISVRMGYIGHEDNPAFTLGVSLKYDDLSIDIGTTAGNNLYNKTMASLNYRFSGLAYKTPAIKKRKFRGIEEKVADPVGTKKQAPYAKEQTQRESQVADPIMTPARKEKTTGSAGLFLLY